MTSMKWIYLEWARTGKGRDRTGTGRDRVGTGPGPVGLGPERVRDRTGTGPGACNSRTRDPRAVCGREGKMWRRWGGVGWEVAALPQNCPVCCPRRGIHLPKISTPQPQGGPSTLRQSRLFPSGTCDQRAIIQQSWHPLLPSGRSSFRARATCCV